MGGAAWFRREATPEPMTGDTWMLTPRWLRRLGDELHAVAHPFLARHLSSPRSEGVRAAIDAFLDAYPRRPVGDNRGGSGFHNCFWLYQVASCMEPDLIIESSVWKGQTAWLFRRACPPNGHESRYGRETPGGGGGFTHRLYQDGRVGSTAQTPRISAGHSASWSNTSCAPSGQPTT